MPAPCSVVPLGTRSAARVAEAISGRWRREGHAQRQARTLAHQEQAIKSVLLGGKRRIQPPVAPLAPAPTLLCAASPGVFGPAAAFETPEHVGRGRKRRLRGLASWQSGNRRIGNVEFCSSTGSAASTGGSRHTGVRCDVVQRKGGGGRGSEGVWAASRRATGRMMLYLLIRWPRTAPYCAVPSRMVRCRTGTRLWLWPVVGGYLGLHKTGTGVSSVGKAQGGRGPVLEVTD